jgi:hypothetical protein
MRIITIIALLAPMAAHAETLSIDTDLLAAANRILAENTQASSSLPAVLDISEGFAAANHSRAEEGSSSSGILTGVGVGLQVGTPTALTFKFGMGGNANLVLGVGLFVNVFHGYGGQFGGLSLHGDYLFTLATLVNNGTIDLTAYLGPGLWLNLFAYNGFAYGVGYGAGYYYFNGGFPFAILGRLPLGLNLRFSAAPIEVYLELDPALLVFPGVDFFIGASLGFRWFF